MRNLIVAAAVCLLAGPAFASESTDSIRKPTNIAAQPLEPALQAFAKERDLQVVYRSEVVGDLRTAGAAGELTAREILDQLLAGTSLTYQYVDGNTITIVPVQTGATARSLPATRGRADGSSMKQLQAMGFQAMRIAQSKEDTEAGADDRDTGANTPGSARRMVEDREVQEVIVTARKISEALQDVPVTVTAFTGEQLQEQGAVDVKDILRAVPGLSFTDVERGQAKYSIRGITSTVETPTTGIYLDDISLVTGLNYFALGAFDAIFFDIDRVEVLKGPQGTLYGGSAMGGAIKYISARPDPTSFSAKVGGGLATIAHGDLSNFAEAVVNVPLIPDVLAIRGGLHYRHEGGFIDNVPGLAVEDASKSTTPFPVYTPLVRDSLSHVVQEDYNSGDILVGRLSMLWQPGDTWSIRPAALYQESKQQNPSQFFTNAPELTASYRLLPQQQKDRTGIFSLDVEKELGPVIITSVSAYFDRLVNFNRDYSYLVGALIAPLFPFDMQASYPYRNKTFSQELRLSSSPDRDSRFDYVLGLYYRDQDFTDSSIVRIFEGESSPLGSPLLLGGPGTGGGRTLIESAVFADVSWHITDAFDFSAGVRLFDYEFDSFSLVTPPDNPAILRNNRAINLSGKEDGVNPRFGASYKLTDDNMVYASAAKGFRPGGTQDFTSAALCAEELQRLGVTPGKFESDDLWAYELGSKNEFGDGRMLLNASVFYNDWKDIQQGIRLTSCGSLYTANLGAARVQGIELETQMRLTPMFEIGGNVTYTEAEITEIAPGTPSTKGDEILDTPEWMASVYSSYLIPLNASWDMKLRMDYRYRSKQRRSVDPNFSVLFPGAVRAPIPYGALYQEGFDVLSAFASFDNGSTSVRLYVDNILDERPLLDERLDVGSSRGTTIRPRTIGLDLRREF